MLAGGKTNLNFSHKSKDRLMRNHRLVDKIYVSEGKERLLHIMEKTKWSIAERLAEDSTMSIMETKRVPPPGFVIVPSTISRDHASTTGMRLHGAIAGSTALTGASSPSPSPPVHGSSDDIVWNDEQNKVLRLVSSCCNVFFGGEAGTGKSALIRAIHRKLVDMYGEGCVCLCATTGIAAVNIGGVTLHRWAGIGIDTDFSVMLKKTKFPLTKKRWLTTRALVIDEVSMLSGDLWDKLEKIARIHTQREIPFGGIQLVLTGDFFQLPPVDRDGGFVFQAQSWPSCIAGNAVLLKKVYRQRDPVFRRILQHVRMGKCTREDEEMLKSRVGAEFPDDGIAPTELYSINAVVEIVNAQKLEKLPGTPVQYVATDSRSMGCNMKLEDITKRFDTDTRVPRKLCLKVGAQVMLIKNIDSGLVNGSRGVVVGFQNRQADSDCPPLPRVRFANGQTLYMPMFEFSIDIKKKGEEVERIYRQQIPLQLAWALTIHKCQGISLDRACISMMRLFEYGQFYVAISRLTTLTGLSLDFFSASEININPVVVDYWKTLFNLEEPELEQVEQDRELGEELEEEKEKGHYVQQQQNHHQHEKVDHGALGDDALGEWNDIKCLLEKRKRSDHDGHERKRRKLM